MVGTYCITRAGLFIGGLYLSLEEMGSYGLMLQLGSIIITLSNTYFNVLQPRLSAYKIENRREHLNSEFLKTWITFVCISITGFVVMIFGGSFILNLIGSNATLPGKDVTIVYSIFLFLETNYQMCINFLVVGNRVPPVSTTLIPGFFIIAGSFLVLQFTTLGLLGLVLVMCIVQMCYNNWYWPLEAAEDMKLPINRWPGIGFAAFFKKRG